ncbi:MAG: hypothetical protein HY909_22460 [Deltaproteobacteria bacterium]|nr:hypothetical protein [Deltaproteobacteria bacterium]
MSANTDSTLHLSLAGMNVQVRWCGVFPHINVHARFGAYLVSPATPDLALDLTVDPDYRPEHPPRAVYPSPEVSVLPDGRIELVRTSERVTWDPVGHTAVARARPSSATLQPVEDPTPMDTPLRELLACALPARQGLLLHASGYGDARGAVVFAAVSGGGKTTTARKLPPDGVLSDDQVAVRRLGDRWMAFALPFVGEYRRATRPYQGPLRALVLLEKSTTGLRLARVPAPEATARALAHTVRFARGGDAGPLLALAADLCRQVPVWSLALGLEEPVVPTLDALLGGSG